MTGSPSSTRRACRPARSAACSRRCGPPSRRRSASPIRPRASSSSWRRRSYLRRSRRFPPRRRCSGSTRARCWRSSGSMPRRSTSSRQPASSLARSPSGARGSIEHMFVEDPSALSEEQLEEELAAQAAHVDAGLCRLLELAAECERRMPWADDGTTFAAWLAWRCSLLPRQAREHERVGKRLADLPLTRSAFARGELSYAKVSVLTRIAEPETEQRLLELAEVMTASQLQRAVGAYRQLAKEEASEQHEREFLDYFWADDGSLSLRARLAAEDGALVLRALEAG